MPEPSGLSRSDGKRPDGVTLTPWCARRSLIWEVTVTCTTADSYFYASLEAAELVGSIQQGGQIYAARLQ